MTNKNIRRYRTNIESGSHVVSRRDLKPKRRMSDEELLADAMRQAQYWDERKKLDQS